MRRETSSFFSTGRAIFATVVMLAGSIEACTLGFGITSGDSIAGNDVPVSDDAGATTIITGDASMSADAGASAPFIGSPLCGVTRYSVCNPDVPISVIYCLANEVPPGHDAGETAVDAGQGVDGSSADAGGLTPAGDAGEGGGSWDAAEDTGLPSIDAGEVADGAESIADAAFGGDADSLPLDGSSESEGDSGPADEPWSHVRIESEDASSVTEACRVLSPLGVPVPTCEAAGPGIDGADCTDGDDCAAEFDCVYDANRVFGTCRRYCCDNECGADGGAASTGSFCTIATLLTAKAQSVPVCAPVIPCELLDPTSCAESTCTVVAADGTTSCVTVGSATEGESCDTQLCGAGLACLGIVGSRSCYQLCATSDGGACVGDAGACCRAGEVCTTSQPLFSNPSIGVCTSGT